MRYLTTLFLLFVALTPAALAGASSPGATVLAVSVQQPAPAAVPDGFEPVGSQPPPEQMPAAPFVMAAYAFVWLALLAYLWSIWRRLQAVERDLAAVSRRLEGAGRRV
jgi:CcmD family protein